MTSCDNISPPHASTEVREGSEKVKEVSILLCSAAPVSCSPATLDSHASSEGSECCSIVAGFSCVSAPCSPAEPTVSHASSEGSEALSSVEVETSFRPPGSTQALCGVRGGTKALLSALSA